jgi:TfoX/Sxy family transcriptional regulator of competence genes
MKTTPFLEYILYDIFGETEPITVRAMMGAHLLYYEGKVFAIAENDELYFKGSKELASWYLERGSKQFTYTKEGVDAHLYYFLVPSEVYEDKSKREEWLDVALSVAKLPKKKIAHSNLVAMS